MTDVDVLVIGSLNLDLVVRCHRMPGPGETVLGSDYREHPGGKGLNQAVAAARAGATVAMVGAVGDDAAGTVLREVLRQEDIDDRLVATVDAPTGRAAITVDDGGENSIVVVPGANALVELPELPSPSVVLGQLEVPLTVVADGFATCRAAGALTVLNPAPAAGGLDALLAVSDLVVPNEHEFDLLGFDAERLASGRLPGDPVVVMTRGDAGVTVFDADGRRHQPPFPVDPVDTTGAGDSFCGALAARLAAGDGLLDAVRHGAAAGAVATTRPGAVPSIPTAEEYGRLLADGA